MRRGGVIPPGKAGLIVIAAAMVPIAIRKFPSVVRWVGKKLEKTGARIAGTADEAERYERERQERVAATVVAEPEHVEAEMVETPPFKGKVKSTSKKDAEKPPKKARKRADFED